jgi:hypothetical protein
MRNVARFVVGVGLVLLLALGALYLLRKPVAEAAVIRIMRNAGFAEPSATVASVSLSRLTLAEVAAGGGAALALRGVALDYHWRELLFEGRAAAISIESGRAAASIGEDGALRVAGWTPKPQSRRSQPPVEAVAVKALQATVETPGGPAELQLAGTLSMATGGRFDIDFAAQAAGLAGFSIADASGTLSLELAQDGALRLAGAIKTDIRAPAGLAQGVDASLIGAVSPWRAYLGGADADPEGEIVLTIRTSTIGAGAADPAVADLSVSGVVRAALADGGIAVTLPDGPLKIARKNGDYLLLSSAGSPLYERRADRRSLAVAAELGGIPGRGTAELRAQSQEKARWAVAARAALAEQTLFGVAIADAKLAFDGEYADRLDGELAVEGAVRSAAVGRLTFADMPLGGRLAIMFDPQTKSFAAQPVEGTCLEVANARLQLQGQDINARLEGAAFCPRSAPLIAVSPERALTMIGALDGRLARLEIGRTVFDGAPPMIDFQLDYDPRTGRSRIVGDFADGRVLLNRAFLLSSAKGGFETELSGDSLSASASLAALKIAQNADSETVAPVAVAGVASLKDDVARFDFKVTTPKGEFLGEGSGAHRMRSGAGEALFDSGELAFTALGLQPDRLVPALRGVISGATGAASLRARFAWTPGAVDSSATIDFDGVSFRGPGVAVSRTEGVAGKLVFTDLAPLTTGGEQVLAIRKIDLDALKLENGEVRFSLPGDDTLAIVKAEFPWFNGRIGAYDSTLSLAGGEAQTTLQIADVDLGALLRFFNIEGLSGEGVIEGALPISFEGARARIDDGVLQSVGPGVLRYQGKAASAASQSNEQTALAFEILREIRFNRLAATIDGPLDGTLDFNILMEGRSDIPVKTGKRTQRIDSPVKYRLSINAPLLSLIEQAILSTDVRLQVERARAAEEEKAE